jgi:hypothetical protein
MMRPEHEAVRYRVCGSKRPLGRDAARNVAQRAQAEGIDLRPYRCPFSHGTHWHVGHIPSLASLRAIAAAIRDLPPQRRAS